MRRIAVLLVGLMALAPVPAMGARMEPYAAAEQAGIALWIERDGRRGTMYMAIGVRGVDSFAGVNELRPAYGAVGKGPCRFGKHGGFCMARGRVKTLGVTDFSVDPLLGSAHMTLAQGGSTHVVDWTGDGTTETESYQSAGEGHYVGAGQFREAPATAVLYGMEMTGNRDFHLILQGASVHSGLGELVRFLPDGTVAVRLRVR